MVTLCCQKDFYLFLKVEEPETIHDGTTNKTIYGTVFVTQLMLHEYAFYIMDGLKIKATEESLHTHQIYFYWPLNSIIDPLIQSNRKLFTVKSSDALRGNIPAGFPAIRTSDKRIGCIPKI